MFRPAVTVMLWSEVSLISLQMCAITIVDTSCIFAKNTPGWLFKTLIKTFYSSVCSLHNLSTHDWVPRPGLWSGLISGLCSESQYYDPSSSPLHWPGRVTIIAGGGNTNRGTEVVVFNAALNIWPGPGLEITELIEIFQLQSGDYTAPYNFYAIQT